MEYPMECPYCSCTALSRLESPQSHNPDEVYFQDASGYSKLTEVNWQAYKCDVCERTLILDEDEVRRIEDAD